MQKTFVHPIFKRRKYGDKEPPYKTVFFMM